MIAQPGERNGVSHKNGMSCSFAELLVPLAISRDLFELVSFVRRFQTDYF